METFGCRACHPFGFRPRIGVRGMLLIAGMTRPAGQTGDTYFRTNDDVEFADIGETPAGQCVAYIHQPQAKIQYHHEFVGSR